MDCSGLRSAGTGEYFEKMFNGAFNKLIYKYKSINTLMPLILVYYKTREKRIILINTKKN